MMGDHESIRILPNPTIEVPSRSLFDDQFNSTIPAGEHLLTEAALAELWSYLPLNEMSPESSDVLPCIDKHSSNEFRMYEFKIRRCTRTRSHDWTDCPYAHPGEKARRRDPRKHQYSGVACPDFRKGTCKKADACDLAHGVFECWLHPARYRTQHCKDGAACRRRVCFFAHTPEQLRVVPIKVQQSSRPIDSYDGSPQRSYALLNPSSPTSTLISPAIASPASSPPASPGGGRMWRVDEVVAAIGKLHFRKVGSGPGSSVVGLRPVFCGLPGWVDLGEKEEGLARVESGPLRAKMYERMSKESGLGRAEADPGAVGAPDIGWVSEFVK